MKTEYLVGAGVLFALAVFKNYCKGGICRADRDLTGQVAVVTGGNTGIGKETARELAARGCSVLIGARDHEKSRLAVQEIRRSTSNPNVDCIELDLGSKLSIEKFADEVKRRYSRIDILVNNAGVMAIPDRRETEDGFEMQMGVNHLGHFYLTYLLWSALKDSPNLRIVNVSSKAQNRNRVDKKVPLTINFETMDGRYPGDGPVHGQYDPWYAYAASKMANVLFTKQLAERLERVNPTARTISLHPGVVRTELARYFITGPMKVLLLLIYPIFWLVSKNCWQGAQTSLYGVLEDKDNIVNGGHYADCKPSVPGTFAMDPINQKSLWLRSEQLLGIKFDL